MQRIVRNWLFLVLGLFYVGTLFVYLGTDILNAPDEHATRLFIDAVRAGELPRIPEERNAGLLNVLHPRSTTVVGNFIVPIGFLGMPFWYGVVAGLLPTAMPASVLTPLLVLLTLGAWYALMRKWLVAPRRALVATVLLATMPAFWYYAARSFMPNVPFVCLLILAVAVFELRSTKHVVPWWTHGMMAGALFGIALSFRLFELPWMLLLGGIYLWANSAAWKWRDLGALACGAFLTFSPILVMQEGLYGDMWTTGYTARDTSVQSLPESSAAAAFEVAHPGSRGALDVILPFGFHERLILNHVFENVFVLMPLLSVFAIIGFIIILQGKDKKWLALAFALLCVSVWLFVVYGSWDIADNPDPRAVTFANSYSRYWLPIYILAIPFVVIGMERVSVAMNVKKQKTFMAIFVAVWALFGSVSVVQGQDGWIATRSRLQQFAQDQEMLLQYIPDEATVITFYADKYIYPHRTVAIGLTNPSVIRALPALLDQSPVYYFGITLPSQDVEYYQRTVLDTLPRVHTMTPVLTIREQTLYRFDVL